MLPGERAGEHGQGVRLMLALLWAECPRETAALCAVAVLCAAGLGVLLCALLIPVEPDDMESMEEENEC